MSIRRWMQVNLFVLYLLLLWHTVDAFTLGLPAYGSYQWHADIRNETGLAFSAETSNVPKDCKFYRLIRDCQNKNMLELLEDYVRTYPSWLCTWPITLGFFKAVPNNSNGAIQIRTRLLNLNLLSFGNFRGERVSYRQDRVRTTICTVSLPIVGGLLALPSSSRNGNKMGALLFTLKKNEQLRDADDSKNKEGSVEDCDATFRTAIADYRPWVVGFKSPPSWVRKHAYLNTQSLVHSYVMWKFHRRLWSWLNANEDNKEVDQVVASYQTSQS
jgi:hypothetical protein